MQPSKIITSVEIGAALKQRRRELGISQEKLAEILNVSYQQVQRYESGANKLNVENIQLVAEILAVPITFFFCSDCVQTVAESPSPYMTAEEKSLLEYFRKINDKHDRRMVIDVARLAAKKQ